MRCRVCEKELRVCETCGKERERYEYPTATHSKECKWCLAAYMRNYAIESLEVAKQQYEDFIATAERLVEEIVRDKEAHEGEPVHAVIMNSETGVISRVSIKRAHEMMRDGTLDSIGGEQT